MRCKLKPQSDPIEKILHDLKERAKELNCLYEVQELLGTPDVTLEQICDGIVHAIPPGWQYPEVCQARIILGDKTYEAPGFMETPWVQKANIIVQDHTIGRIEVYYTDERPLADEGPFLKEERKLINTIAEQLGNYILHQQLKEVFAAQRETEREHKPDWWVIVQLLKRTDPSLCMRIARKMINYLYWKGVVQAEVLLETLNPKSLPFDENRPFQLQDSQGDLLNASDEIFSLAGEYLPESEILDVIQQWIKEDQSGFLLNTVVNPSSSLGEIGGALERYRHLRKHGLELSEPRERSIRVSLMRRVLNDQPTFIGFAEKYCEIKDFDDLLENMIAHNESHGRLGGKGVGLFLAQKIIRSVPGLDPLFKPIKVPITWYIASDSMFYFMSYNNLEDFVVQKYKDISQVRQEYPYLVHMFKSAALPPEIIRGLSLVLDDIQGVPLIVRSSSLLEDQYGLSFAGKYKSLFLPNNGSKEERLKKLVEAITEVYASTFAPDPIQYRAEHGLIHHHEEMGILIQEVVGSKVGHYYFPAFAGVAFSHNNFRWSSRIRREDGFVRLVPGLGTRAVDRLSDDYPIMLAPGKPKLKINVTPEEVVRYAPKKMDVINLESGQFETVEVNQMIKQYGVQYPYLSYLLSEFSEGQIRPAAHPLRFGSAQYVVTFEGIIERTGFLKQLDTVLRTLQEHLGYPVDIEFAFDGEAFYLLQCRAQSDQEEEKPAILPTNLPQEKVLFQAHKYIPNGSIDDVAYIVYVVPSAFYQLTDFSQFIEVGKTIGKLNKLLPKRRFILIGPGRWGSRGDIKSGVSVGYADICNTILLVEIAQQFGEFQPEPSFGTHFFQDLVEASIRYIPIYVDDPGVYINHEFLAGTENLLPKLLPEHAHLSHVIRLIGLSEIKSNLKLSVRMNSDLETAIAFLVEE